MVTMHEINPLTDLNTLYNAYLASKKGSSWKADAQKFEMNWLTELAKLKQELENQSYTTTPGKSFKISERGKTRLIVGNCIRDRVVRHAFCDNILTPITDKYLIYDNGASRKGKGISFTRDRLKKHLISFCNKYGNDGFILTIDFSKYYDNIRHDKIRALLSKDLDAYQMWLLGIILDDFKVDVSYLTDEEFLKCLDIKYDSLATKPITEYSGTKYMDKSVNIGDQTSQNIGIYYPTRIDNYVKIVRSQKYYGRYMDDSYIISNNKDELKSILEGIKTIASELGIFINDKKTQIFRLSKGFRFLQYWYQVTNTGRIIIKINPARIVAMRRKLKKLFVKVKLGLLDLTTVQEMFHSWICNYYKVMSKKQRLSITSLYNSLIASLKE